ncbi:MAG TPA: hypothetical protein VM846_08920 [Vicinamibacterales bacterium]|nr:hypothetical protein [Vicinamibacterales bacterium]
MEADEHVNVLAARSVATVDGTSVSFDDLWNNRRSSLLAPDVAITLPDLAGLIQTKQINTRPKDLEDIRLLEVLRQEEGS